MSDAASVAVEGEVTRLQVRIAKAVQARWNKVQVLQTPADPLA